MKKFTTLSLLALISAPVLADNNDYGRAGRAAKIAISPAVVPAAVGLDIVTLDQEEFTDRYIDSMRKEPKRDSSSKKCAKKDRTHHEGKKSCHKDDKKCHRERTHFEGHKNDSCKSCNKPCKKGNNSCRKHCITGRAEGDHHHGDDALTNFNNDTKCHHRGNCHHKNHKDQQKKTKRARMSDDNGRMMGNAGGAEMDQMGEDMWAQ